MEGVTSYYSQAEWNLYRGFRKDEYSPLKVNASQQFLIEQAVNRIAGRTQWIVNTHSEALVPVIEVVRQTNWKLWMVLEVLELKSCVTDICVLISSDEEFDRIFTEEDFNFLQLRVQAKHPFHDYSVPPEQAPLRLITTFNTHFKVRVPDKYRSKLTQDYLEDVALSPFYSERCVALYLQVHEVLSFMFMTVHSDLLKNVVAGVVTNGLDAGGLLHFACSSDDDDGWGLGSMISAAELHLEQLSDDWRILSIDLGKKIVTQNGRHSANETLGRLYELNKELIDDPDEWMSPLTVPDAYQGSSDGSDNEWD